MMMKTPETTKFLKALLWLTLCLAVQNTQAATTTSTKLKDQVEQQIYNLNEADENGVYLMGVFDVHRPAAGVIGCSGPIDLASGESSSRRVMQNLWAFLWAIDQVNQDDTLLPGVRLGSLVLDSCSSLLQTNQQLANLLQGHHADLPSRWQFAGLVADQRDWRSVEASASIASSLGSLATFVTQTRSTKLTELALTWRSRDVSEMGVAGTDDPPQVSSGGRGLNDQRFLKDLLGIGHMMPALELAKFSPTDPTNQQAQQTQVPELRLIKMLPGNELMADALASLCDQMKWDLISIVYDSSESDLVDLHDELIRELFVRNTQLALDEPFPLAPALKLASASGPEATSERAGKQQEQLLLRLAQKSQMGSRVVISLLGVQAARQLQSKLKELRNSLDSAKLPRGQLHQLNSLQWITITDREPYYSYATDSLGTIAVSSASSLMPEFKQFYDKLKLSEGSSFDASATGNASSGALPVMQQPRNKWWPEYVRALMQRHRSELGDLLVDECAKWQEPTASTLNEKCRQLDLSTLVQLEKSRQRLRGLNSLMPGDASTNSNQNKPPNKLAKFLASGWDHNGMDVINSVLTIANGLELVRQNLCPNTSAGLCPEMRQLIRATHDHEPSEREQISQDSQAARRSLSELVHEELFGATFQLADSRLFKLPPRLAQDSQNSLAALISAAAAAAAAAAHSGGDSLGSESANLLAANGAAAGSSQLDTKLKFYNLRFLSANSIGFVKFAHFHKDEGLVMMGKSQALHYSSLPQNYSDTMPVEQVNSSCQDESRCLMLSSSFVEAPTTGPVQSSKLNEEQLASKLNSLFKLDHPLISQGNSGADFGIQSQRNRSDSQQQDSTITTMRTMRSLPTQFVHFHDPFASSPLEAKSEQLQASKKAKSRRLFEVIVLLPLHYTNNSSQNNQQQEKDEQGDKWASCPPEGAGRLDAAHSFSRLAALAYAQQLVNGRLEALAGANSVGNKQTTDSRPRQSNSSQAQAQQDGAQASNELLISVIDYCGQKDLAAESLAQVLRSRRSVQQQQQALESIGSSTRSGASAQPPQLVAVLDFDARLSSTIDAVLSSTNYSHLLHLSIAQRAPGAPMPLRPIVSEAEPKQLTRTSKRQALRIDLMPSKAHEIEAMIKLLKSFPNWRLVHLIYTDQHEFRDEFIRRANEANICVSKLIWIPQLDTDADEALLEQQVNKTRQLFERELFHQKQGDKITDESTAVTHVLVVLASSSHTTNKLILRAATQPMLKDYVWLTSHEWLASIEKPMEAKIDSMDFGGGGGSKRLKLPKNFLSTEVESFEGSHGFRQYFSHLLPALHEPLPDDWFDELWQQHFHCKLAFSKHHRDQPQNDCNYTQRLDPEDMGPDGQDGLVPYAIRAIEALHMALVDFGAASSATSLNGRGVDKLQFERLERDFRQAFDLGTREVVGNVDSSEHQAKRRHPQALVGFHIVHRVLPKREYIKWNGRAIEEPKMSFYHLARVGLWRDHYQLQHGLKLALAPFGLRHWTTNKTQVLAANGVNSQIVEDLKPLLRSRPVSIQATLEQHQLQSSTSQNSSDLRLPDESNDDLQELKRISDSLQIISKIDSQCFAKSTCSQLCKRQIEQTFTLIKLEEARLSLNEQASGEEPRASSNLFVSSLDTPKSNFDDDDDDDDEDQENEAKSEAQATNNMKQSRDLLNRNELDDIQAAASSLFDAGTSQQVASDTRRSYKRHFSTQRSAGGLFAFGNSDTEGSGVMRRYSGLLLSALSMVGVAFTVASMTYFYPNMLDKRQSLDLHQQNGTRRLKRFNQSSRSTSSSQCNIIMEDAGEEAHQGHYQQRGCFLSSILDNIADYLLLTGLLMLYSINVAFILPATVGVCWFRRVGLAMSYTIVFSSILVKVREIRTRQLVAVSTGKLSRQQANRQQLEPVAESAESGERAIKPNGRNHMEQGASIISHAKESQRQSLRQVASQVHSNSLADSFRLPLGLMLVQLAVSMVWLVEQPPEPTLYQYSCWHCASLARSPVLFLYEPLLCLIGPALILAVSWLWSIVAFNEASKRDSELSQHIKQMGLDMPPPPARLQRQQHQLSAQLRDSKLLVIASTLLVLLWASLTLSVVSTSQRLLWDQNSSGDRANYRQKVALKASHTDDQALVYANLLSGAIVFSLLFIYRLSWLGLFGCSDSNKASHYDEIEGAIAGGVAAAKRQKRHAAFRLFRSRRGSSSLSGPASEQQVHKFNATSLQMGGPSEATTNGDTSQERLKLQQFNMTYGTYSAGSTAGRPQEDTTDLRGSCKLPKSRGMFKLKSKTQKGCSSNQLQRHQSNGSLASSQVPLVASQRSSGRSRGRSHLGGASLDDDRNNSDAVSCNGSIASNATSQLQGSDLKPIMLDFLRVLQLEHSQLQQRQLDGEVPLDSLVAECTPEEKMAAARQLEPEEEEAARQEEAAKEGDAPRELKPTSETDDRRRQDQAPCRGSGSIAGHQQEHQNEPRGLEVPQV